MPNDLHIEDGVALQRVATRPSYAAPTVLLSNASATGQPSAALAGGTYVWTIVGTFDGATATLQSLGPDGSTWLDVVARTSAGSERVLVGQGSSLRTAVAGGTPSGLYANVARVG